TKHLGKPVVCPGKNSKDSGHSHDQMEVGRNKVGIMQIDVERSLSQEEAGNAARNKEGNEPERIEHGRRKANLSTPKGAEPIERLDGRGNSDSQCQYGEGDG